MVDLSRATLWWDGWQLRTLVLASTVAQWILFVSAFLRKRAIPSFVRKLIWLVYLANDALAIYALATLFNRHKNSSPTPHGQGSIFLEVLWAPILLMHLAGQITITAYNIEDNELYMRYYFTMMSQIVVAIYVFLKSWLDHGDKGLTWVALLLFSVGIAKCFDRPYYLRSSSVIGLSSRPPARARKSALGGDKVLLQSYLQQARNIVRGQADHDHPPPTPVQGGTELEPHRLILDFISPYSDRLKCLQSFCMLDEDKAHTTLQVGLCSTFGLVYAMQNVKIGHFKGSVLVSFGTRVIMLLVAIGLFHMSKKEAYTEDDIKVTYVLFSSAAMLELCLLVSAEVQQFIVSGWPEEVAQYNFIRFCMKKQSKRVKLGYLLLIFGVPPDNIDVLLQPLFYSMKPCRPPSCQAIIKLVLAHLKAGWKDFINDVATYRIFNDLRGQWTLKRHVEAHLRHITADFYLDMPFDKCVLLWHIATDFCFYYSNGASCDHQCATSQCTVDASSGNAHGCAAWCKHFAHHGIAVQCREISNYMMHLLYVNPEMLMVGTRRYLFSTAFGEFKDMLKHETVPTDEIGLAQKIIEKVKQQHGSHEGLIQDAWALSERLLEMNDGEKMWKVIEGVWVEMLCFSAGRCRGYLHGKSLGDGGELLNYVWLLLSYMGMETLAEKLQRADLPIEGGNTDATPLSSKVYTDPNSSTTEASLGAAPSTSKALTSTTSSTSEINVVID
ncbi:hypothetical protein ACP70R_044790 [Stipagrostis hirtigluma subsp. patula]